MPSDWTKGNKKPASVIHDNKKTTKHLEPFFNPMKWRIITIINKGTKDDIENHPAILINTGESKKVNSEGVTLTWKTGTNRNNVNIDITRIDRSISRFLFNIFKKCVPNFT